MAKIRLEVNDEDGGRFVVVSEVDDRQYGDDGAMVMLLSDVFDAFASRMVWPAAILSELVGGVDESRYPDGIKAEVAGFIEAARILDVAVHKYPSTTTLRGTLATE